MRQTEPEVMCGNDVAPAWPGDEELVQRLRSADEAALGILMKKYSSRIMSAALRILRTRSEAEEVTQDVFLALWRSPERFDAAKGPLVTWLVILSRSRALDLLRRIKARTRKEKHLPIDVLAVRQLLTPSFNPDRHLIIEEILGRLPSKQEWVIRSAYFDGYALGEIAERQHLPLGTVKGRARFAIRKLRSELTPAQLSPQTS
ncbi:MAG TPA: sigma-70 family RNA polymerase sigma factor [Bryobacteraceae bacterium]|jgi:RNA polymerase sigma-70 factor (ECF subfamily)|nr:sigma-70 family RNA polymerase sigma factor [Bryobacteraceae bacterium]